MCVFIYLVEENSKYDFVPQDSVEINTFDEDTYYERYI